MRQSMVATLLMMVLAAGPAAAQSKSGTTIAQFLAIEPGARQAGMGNTGVALYEGIQAVYYNPGALGQLSGPALQFTHSDWYAGINYDYAAGALPLKGVGTLFASVTALNSGDIEVRTVNAPLGTGERYTVSDVALGLGYGRQITSRFGAGLQLNYVNESIWHSSSQLLTMNVGTTYRLTEDGLRLGASIANLGTRARFDGRDLAILFDGDPDLYGDNSSLPGALGTDPFPVPILFRVGLSYPGTIAPGQKILLMADAFHPSDNTESVSLGAEYSLRQFLAVRAGWQNLFLEDSDVGLTLGVGVGGRIGDSRFQFDYAWADHKYLDQNHRLTFGLAF